MKLLLTGFEPFLGFEINPTEAVVKNLDGKQIGKFTIIGKILPVDFKKGPEQLLKHMEEINPDAVISLGLAAGRTHITPERIAINCQDGEPDNNGVQLTDHPIDPNGPDGYFSKLPIRKIVNQLNEAGLPAEISNTAGTYLCNNVMYSMIHDLVKREKDIPAGFIHIPASHELVVKGKKRMASWSTADLTKAIEIVIECL
jgi:pyroglutamyl-peptidase